MGMELDMELDMELENRRRVSANHHNGSQVISCYPHQKLLELLGGSSDLIEPPLMAPHTHGATETAALARLSSALAIA